MKTKLVFCTKEQIETDHVVSIDNNGEFLFLCKCGDFLKLPGDFSSKQIDEYLGVHKKANEGQISLELIEKANAEKLKNI